MAEEVVNQEPEAVDSTETNVTADRKNDADKAQDAVVAEQTESPWQKRSRRRMRALRSFLIRLILLVLAVYILVFHIVGLTLMPCGDMAPRLDAGDMLLFYRIDRTAKSRDIVVIDKAVNTDYSAKEYTIAGDPGIIRKALNWMGFKDPGVPPTTRFVCRVVACPGDTVEITEENGLRVNGEAPVESNIYGMTLPYEGYLEYPVKLGEGEYFVLSDSRNGGVDSRLFGPVTQEEIQGIVITILRRNNL